MLMVLFYRIDCGLQLLIFCSDWGRGGGQILDLANSAVW